MNESEILDKLEIENKQISTINKRSLAFLIDEIIISVLFVLIFWDNFAQFQTMDMVNSFIQSIAIPVLLTKVAYQTIFVWMYGATLGKMVVKIKVVSVDDLERPNFIFSLIRAFGRIVDELLFYIGFIVAFFSKARLTWHDRFAKTLVIDV